jgi:hypothetical protein
MNGYLVVRCGVIDGVNPIEEVDCVIARHGHCWFGKYGQRIAGIARRSEKSPLIVVLAGGRKISKPGNVPAYALSGWSPSVPAVGYYPAYYKYTLERISTWLKLERTTESTIATKDLVIKSSLQPLQDALHSSMRGYFWCIRKQYTSRA